MQQRREGHLKKGSEASSSKLINLKGYRDGDPNKTTGRNLSQMLK